MCRYPPLVLGVLVSVVIVISKAPSSCRLGEDQQRHRQQDQQHRQAAEGGADDDADLVLGELVRVVDPGDPDPGGGDLAVVLPIVPLVRVALQVEGELAGAGVHVDVVVLVQVVQELPVHLPAELGHPVVHEAAGVVSHPLAVHDPEHVVVVVDLLPVNAPGDLGGGAPVHGVALDLVPLVAALAVHPLVPPLVVVVLHVVLGPDLLLVPLGLQHGDTLVEGVDGDVLK